MAEVNWTNQVDVTGQYGETSSPISFSSNIVSTTIVQGLTVTKKADKEGPLTYTMTITNSSGKTLTGGVLTDKLNIDIVELNTTYGVQIDGSPTSNYTYNGGELKVALPELADQGDYYCGISSYKKHLKQKEAVMFIVWKHVIEKRIEIKSPSSFFDYFIQ